MAFSSALKYTKEHEWIKIDGTTGIIGVTDYAIEQLGDVVYLDLPKVGAIFKINDTFGSIESTKTVSDLFIPVSGKILEVNKSILDAPESLATDPYNKGWLVKIEIDATSNNLLSATEYEAYIKSQE